MPTYDYHCETNGRTVEVQHRMSDSVTSWGQLCELAGIDSGETPTDAPVTKLLTGGAVITKGGFGGGGDMPPCATGGCASGMCGL